MLSTARLKAKLPVDWSDNPCKCAMLALNFFLSPLNVFVKSGILEGNKDTRWHFIIFLLSICTTQDYSCVVLLVTFQSLWHCRLRKWCVIPKKNYCYFKLYHLFLLETFIFEPYLIVILNAIWNIYSTLLACYIMYSIWRRPPLFLLACYILPCTKLAKKKR